MSDKGYLILGAALGIIFLMTRSDNKKVLLSQFINPASVANIAAQLPASEDDFIIAAHQYVTDHVRYDGFETTIRLTPDYILCQKCYLPVTVLNRGISNCVGMSVLLESILRNRIPASRTYMVVGQLHQADSGGHCWVIVDRGGIWYLLESTRPPAGWNKQADLENTYEPEALVNDTELICMDPELCINIKRVRCSCNQTVPQLLY